jgi:hypothetical protein
VETAKITFKWWFVQHKEWSMVEVAISSAKQHSKDDFVSPIHYGLLTLPLAFEAYNTLWKEP